MEELRVPPNFYQDESGKWWRKVKWAGSSHGKVSADIATCEACGTRWVFALRNGSATPRSCSAKCRPVRTGKDSPHWEGGRSLTADGYIRVLRPEHPRATKGGTVMEHRLVMEQSIGRFLTVKENVHHINGVRTDNRLENLELWVVSQPSGQRLSDTGHCPTCTCVVRKEVPSGSEFANS